MPSRHSAWSGSASPAEASGLSPCNRAVLWSGPGHAQGREGQDVLLDLRRSPVDTHRTGPEVALEALRAATGQGVGPGDVHGQVLEGLLGIGPQQLAYRAFRTRLPA